MSRAEEGLLNNQVRIIEFDLKCGKRSKEIFERG